MVADRRVGGLQHTVRNAHVREVVDHVCVHTLDVDADAELGAVAVAAGAEVVVRTIAEVVVQDNSKTGDNVPVPFPSTVLVHVVVVLAHAVHVQSSAG
jgi:hypothetical protein